MGVITTKVQELDHTKPVADLPPRSSQSNHLRLINSTTSTALIPSPVKPTYVSQTISRLFVSSFYNPPRQTPSFTSPSFLTGSPAAQPSTSPSMARRYHRTRTRAIQHRNHRGEDEATPIRTCAHRDIPPL